MFSVSYFFTQYCTYVYVYIYANTYLTKRVRCGPVLSVAVRRLTQRLSREYEIQYVRLQKIQTYPTAIGTYMHMLVWSTTFIYKSIYLYNHSP